MPWVYNADAHANAMSEYPKIVTVCITLTVVMATIVGMRVYVRGRILRSFGPDDWTIIAAAVCSCVYNGLCIGQSRWGLGLPLALRPNPNLVPYTLVGALAEGARRPLMEVL